MHFLEKALEIAVKAYAGQLDKAGKVYILHPLRVMAKMETETEMAVALLHDVIEDSDFTAQELLDAGIPANVVEAVTCLTKQAGENYEQFIERAMQNPLARKVKLADIEDNMNVLRLNSLDEKDLARVQKYHIAWQRLQQNKR